MVSGYCESLPGAGLRVHTDWFAPCQGGEDLIDAVELGRFFGRNKTAGDF